MCQGLPWGDRKEMKSIDAYAAKIDGLDRRLTYARGRVWNPGVLGRNPSEIKSRCLAGLAGQKRRSINLCMRVTGSKTWGHSPCLLGAATGQYPNLGQVALSGGLLVLASR